MTIFVDSDFKEVTTHDGFVNRDKDFTAALDDVIIQPLGRKDSIAVSLKFSDDPEGEKLLSIFGIDGDKDGSYNRKMSWGAFVESLAKCGVKTLVAKKIKEGTNMDDPAYEYAVKFDPQLKGTGTQISMHVEHSKYTKDGVEKTSDVWTVVSVNRTGTSTPSTQSTKPSDTGADAINLWRDLIVNDELIKKLSVPIQGQDHNDLTIKKIILNLKSVVHDEKKCSAMKNNFQKDILPVLVSEGLAKFENGVIKPT